MRVSERFLPDEKASSKQMKELRAHAAAKLEALGWWSGGGRLVGIGGTIRNLAAAAMKQLDIPDIDVQGFLLTRDALEELIDELASRPASKRDEVKGIKYDRADVILGGALVLATALDEGGFDAIEVTEAGLREGAFFERLLGKDGLFDDVRSESVHNLAHRFGHDDDHSAHVWELSASMYDGLAAAGLHDYGAEERELLWAACILHDIGVAVDYDDHHRHSYYLILNAGLPGFTPRELVLIGLIARYHRKGEPDASDLGDLAEPGDDHRLQPAVRGHPARGAAGAKPRPRDHGRERLGERRRRGTRGAGRPGPRRHRPDLGRAPQRGPAGRGARPRRRDRGLAEPRLRARRAAAS